MSPDAIREAAKTAASYSWGHKCTRVHLMSREDLRALVLGMAEVAGVECRITKTKPVDHSMGKGHTHVKARTSIGWVHLLNVHEHKGEDFDLLHGVLSPACDGYWEIYG